MKRTARTQQVKDNDLWGHSTGLPQIMVGNTMNLNNNERSIKTNTAIHYGETLHKPAGGKVVEDDKKLQKARQEEQRKQRIMDLIRYDKNITNPKEYFCDSKH